MRPSLIVFSLVFSVVLMTWPIAATAQTAPGAAEHAELFNQDLYPSASKCATCHLAQYEEWRYSSHAYASISPMFHKFEQAINDLSQGTVGYFCMRCHASVGTTLGEPREMPVWERSQVSREGVTCITCHRVAEEYGKSNGARRIEPGSIFEPVYGGVGGDGVAKVAADPKAYNVRFEDGGLGLEMHRRGIRFEQLGKSEFCTSCHQVAVHPGIKLETVVEEYRASPAQEQGISCQDCHMSTRPGQPSGYATGPAAVVNGKVVVEGRKRTNHAFVGPGYPTAHPGIFPHNPAAERFTVEQWLRFDYRAGWGTDDFETKVARGEPSPSFPDPWGSADDRVEARLIIDDNLKKLEEKRQLRSELMEAGSKLEGPFFDRPPRPGEPLRFHYKVSNLNSGHNLPSGSLGAQPEVWLNVALIDPDGNNVWESGYVDSHGDMADLHSLDLAAGKIEHDDQLFNLQSKFITTNLKGTDREMYLPVPFDADQLPFIRPGAVPTSVLNHPPTIRMEKRSLPPLATREASYTVPAEVFSKPGTWKLAARLRSRAEPIYFMKFVGATLDMERAMNEWMLDIHPETVVFEAGSEPRHVEHDSSVFRPDPSYEEKPYDIEEQLKIYGGKHANRTARPLLELGRKLYTQGVYEKAHEGFGKKNPSATHFMVYGDVRVAGAYVDDGAPGANGKTHQSTVAARLNLELDWQMTATERIHAFARPFDQDGSFLRYDFDGKNEGYTEEFDFNLETLFFEGEIGPLWAGITGRDNQIDLPFTLGLIPMLTQNGVWLNDAFLGFAFAIPAKTSARLDISNFDLTFFAGFDKVTTAAVPGDDLADLYGFAGFVDANRGYWEFGYGYVDSEIGGLSYHNLTAAFSKRYGAFVSNSVRVIANLGQDPDPGFVKTADGVLLLVESSLISSKPQTLIPYFNLFAAFDRPQPLALTEGGVLNNTGINFEQDAITSYPSLAAAVRDAYGAAIGVEYLFNLDRQIVVEAAWSGKSEDLDPIGEEYALGLRFQEPLSNAWILRFDAMHGWRENVEDVYGVRVEIRRKF